MLHNEVKDTKQEEWQVYMRSDLNPHIIRDLKPIIIGCDFHWGAPFPHSENNYREVEQRLNSGEKIALLGDIGDFKNTPTDKLTDLLSKMAPVLGKALLAVPGNHDILTNIRGYYNGISQACSDQIDTYITRALILEHHDYPGVRFAHWLFDQFEKKPTYINDWRKKTPGKSRKRSMKPSWPISTGSLPNSRKGWLSPSLPQPSRGSESQAA